MPEPVVQARFDAPPAAVLAALTSRLHAQGDRVTAVSGFGTVVTWESFDADVELVELVAQIGPDPDWPGHTLLVVQRVDASLEAAIGTSRRIWGHQPQPSDAERPAG